MATAKPKRIIYGKFSNGQGISKYDQSRFPLLSGDITTEVGTARCSLALKVETNSSVITEPCFQCVTKSGSVYFFSKNSGKIWKRDIYGNYTSIGANGYGASYGCLFFDNWVYYASITKIGRFHTDGEGSRNDGFGIFNNASAFTHPMAIINMQLFVADQQDLWAVNTNGNFSLKLSLQAHQDITNLKAYGYDLLIYTMAGNSTLEGEIYRYDTASTTFSSEDSIKSNGTCVAISSDDSDRVFSIVANNLPGGTPTADIYEYVGTRLQFFSRINNVSPVVNWQNTTNYSRQALFSIGGNIYSMVSPENGMEMALTLAYTCSQGPGATIHSMEGLNGQILVMWQNGGSYGVDIFDTNYATSVVTTPLYMGRNIHDVQVSFASLPAGTSIQIWTSSNGQAFVQKDTIVDNSDMQLVRLNSDLSNARSYQAQIILVPNGNLTPIIQLIEFI